MTTAFSVFGPRQIVQEVFVCSKGHSIGHASDRVNKELEVDKFMQIFKETFLPWCLHGNNESTSSRLDLLLASLDDECFSEQWSATISYAINLEGSEPASWFQDSDNINILAMLLEKARNRIMKGKLGEGYRKEQGVNPALWHHRLLESAAIAIARSHSLSGACYSRFVW